MKAAMWAIAGLVAVILVVLISNTVSAESRRDTCLDSNTSTLLAEQPGDNAPLLDCG